MTDLGPEKNRLTMSGFTLGSRKGLPMQSLLLHPQCKGHDSKVVDVNGNLLRVFHYGFFDPSAGDLPDTTAGMHFGTLAAAQARSFGKIVDDALLDMTISRDERGRWHWDMADGLSSFDFNENGFESKAAARTDAERAAIDISDHSDGDGGYYVEACLMIANPLRLPDQGADWSEAIAKAKAAGYDGIVYRNNVEDAGSESWVVFLPEQIIIVHPRDNGEDLALPIAA